MDLVFSLFSFKWTHFQNQKIHPFSLAKISYSLGTHFQSFFANLLSWVLAWFKQSPHKILLGGIDIFSLLSGCCLNGFTFGQIADFFISFIEFQAQSFIKRSLDSFSSFYTFRWVLIFFASFISPPKQFYHMQGLCRFPQFFCFSPGFLNTTILSVISSLFPTALRDRCAISNDLRIACNLKVQISLSSGIKTTSVVSTAFSFPFCLPFLCEYGTWASFSPPHEFSCTSPRWPYFFQVLPSSISISLSYNSSIFIEMTGSPLASISFFVLARVELTPANFQPASVTSSSYF